MCGIAGAFSKTTIHREALQCATDVMEHRGPDSGGYYTDDTGRIFFGHRRLSIIDLSSVANQPMYSADGRYVMVYNGEVYNFNELRAKLPGQQWKTHSDTEVILELFAKYGAESFAWLNGMFSVVIHDKQEQKLYISRDQIGIKPLFYYKTDKDFVFASELKVIANYVKSENLKLSINHTAVPYFLHLGFIPEPLTIYKDVHKFPAAHTATLDISNGNLDIKPYWRPEDHFLKNPIRDEKTALERYRKTLFESVESQMVSDVPLGTFLSGGIDSSLVTAVASKLSNQKVNTFSIGFNEAKYDESKYAAAVADHLGTNHHTFKVSVNDVLELVPSLLDVYDEPFADSSAFPTMLVSRLARQHVTVTLSGDGGDELFQGYGMYTWANRLDNPLVQTFRKPLYAATQMMNNRLRRGGALFNYPSKQRIHTHIFSQEQYMFGEQELQQMLVNPSFDFGWINKLQVSNGNAAEKQALWDLKHYLKDDLLVKVDRASMKYSLESRVPLLDIRLIELALNIDYDLKVNKEYGTKYLMKKVLYDLVPRAHFERPKRGFAIPLREWLQGPLHYLIENYLSEETVAAHGVVKPEVVRSLLQQFEAGADHAYGRVWLLIVLHWWLSKNN
ncbi:MAG: asparagine synthase (glutamine-hydrolyzing) [Sphingobacteriales bacterium]|nr:MAG: asparagine synthase (glutamine-hydrolyzing) [Sphingobacteriales bacterium]